MDPISIALALSQFVPGIVKWISGSDKAENAAQAVVDIAKQVTGKSTGEEALAAIQADPAMALQYSEAIMANSADLDKAFLADRQDARKRDIELAKLGQRNHRADIMVLLDVVGIIACLCVLIFYREKIPGEVVGILSTIAGLFGACLRDAHQFEFGSSRSSQNKDSIISNLSKG